MCYMKYLTGNILPIIKYYAGRDVNAVQKTGNLLLR